VKLDDDHDLGRRQFSGVYLDERIQNTARGSVLSAQCVPRSGPNFSLNPNSVPAHHTRALLTSFVADQPNTLEGLDRFKIDTRKTNADNSAYDLVNLGQQFGQ
jgi:hypothetical protein